MLCHTCIIPKEGKESNSLAERPAAAAAACLLLTHPRYAQPYGILLVSLPDDPGELQTDGRPIYSSSSSASSLTTLKNLSS
jgi:hypothetical protein